MTYEKLLFLSFFFPAFLRFSQRRLVFPSDICPSGFKFSSGNHEDTDIQVSRSKRSSFAYLVSMERTRRNTGKKTPRHPGVRRAAQRLVPQFRGPWELLAPSWPWPRIRPVIPSLGPMQSF